MTHIGILSNAHSRRNQSAMAAIDKVLSGYPDVVHRSFSNIGALPEAIAALAGSGAKHLIINGGDGTAQAVLNELLDRSPFEAMPRITLIGGGMTNVIAHDVGIPSGPVEALRHVLKRVGRGNPGQVLHRTAIAMKFGGRNKVEYGFLAGAVGFYQGTRLVRRDVHRVGLRESFATKAGVAWSVVRLLLHGEGERSGLYGERVAIGINGAPPQESPYLFILATTLDRLMPGVMPFWGHDHGAIKLTTIASPAQSFSRAAFSVMRGRPRAWMRNAGYASTRADRISLHLKSPIVVDGEVFDLGPYGHVELSAGPSVAFHRY